MRTTSWSTLLVALETVAVHAISLSPKATKPDGAYVVPKDFIGFGIEAAFINNYTGDFTQNLISSVASRMSEKPVMRIGGTSGDKFTFDPNQSAVRVCASGDCPNGSNAAYILGPSYFDGFKSFTMAKINIQAPLGATVNLTNSKDYVTRAYNNVGADRVDAIALGNEPEWYDDTAKEYVTGALKVESALIDALGLEGDDRVIFEAGNTASENAGSSDHWKSKAALNQGINDNGFIKNMAEHYYQVSKSDVTAWDDANMQKLMTNHKAITNRLNKYNESIQAAINVGVKYYIDEDAAVLGGAPAIFSCGFGYTLWAVDFNLMAMSRGVSRVINLAGRPTAVRQFWVPDASGGKKNPGPHARAPFPAALFVADFIGMGDDTAVANIDLDITERPYLSAYGMYDAAGGDLLRVALVNMRVYNGTSATADRGSEDFTVAVPDGVASVKVQRLHAGLGVAAMGFDYAGATGNVSWAGEQWSYKVDAGKGHYTTGSVEEETVTVSNGNAVVNVPNSEAVIVFIKS